MSPAVLLPTLPRHQTAIVAQGPGELAIKHDAPVPSLAPDMAIVQCAAVAINPVDAKMLDYSAAPGAIHGYDFAGNIVSLGKDAIASGRWAVGDRVAGFVYGMNSLQPDVGAFAEYVGATADILLKLPDRMSFEEAATLGLGIGTAALALFSELRIPASLEQLRKGRTKPVDIAGQEKPPFVLVAGGATASGTRAIQLLKLAGLRPIATCSLANFELALKFGAEKVFDYHSATCAGDIRAYTGGQLAHALDCVSLADTTELCYKSIGRAGGRYVSLEPFREAITKTRPTVEPSWILALSLFGRDVALDGEYRREASSKDRKFGAEAFAVVQDLLDRGLIDVHPMKIMSGGWQGVIKGVDLVRKGAFSGYKLVYTLP